MEKTNLSGQFLSLYQALKEFLKERIDAVSTRLTNYMTANDNAVALVRQSVADLDSDVSLLSSEAEVPDFEWIGQMTRRTDNSRLGDHPANTHCSDDDVYVHVHYDMYRSKLMFHFRVNHSKDGFSGQSPQTNSIIVSSSDWYNAFEAWCKKHGVCIQEGNNGYVKSPSSVARYRAIQDNGSSECNSYRDRAGVYMYVWSYVDDVSRRTGRYPRYLYLMVTDDHNGYYANVNWWQDVYLEFNAEKLH